MEITKERVISKPVRLSVMKFNLHFRFIDNRKLLNIAILVIVFIFCFIVAFFPRMTGPSGDFWGSAVMRAQDLLARRDPYFSHEVSAMSIPYPATAFLVGIPFASLSSQIAGPLFEAITGTLLAYGLMRGGQYWRLMALASYPFLENLNTCQWSSLLACIVLFPDFLPFALVKPHIALPAVLWRFPTRRAILLTALFLLASFVIYPTWPLVWLSQISQYEGVSFIPVLLPGGLLLLMSALRWRTPEGRLLLSMSLLPKRPIYDSFLLMLIPKTWQEMLFLTLASWVYGLHLIFPIMFWVGQVTIYLASFILVIKPLFVRKKTLVPVPG